MKNLDGNGKSVRFNAGKVVLAVEHRQLLRQHAAIQGAGIALYQKYRKGADGGRLSPTDFGSQEPGNSKGDQEFCELTYGVKFRDGEIPFRSVAGHPDQFVNTGLRLPESLDSHHRKTSAVGQLAEFLDLLCCARSCEPKSFGRKATTSAAPCPGYFLVKRFQPLYAACCRSSWRCHREHDFSGVMRTDLPV